MTHPALARQVDWQDEVGSNSADGASFNYDGCGMHAPAT